MKPDSLAAALIAATLLLAAATNAAAQSNAKARAEVFDAVVKTVSEQFYDPAFHGVNWPDVHARYRVRLGNVTSDVELQRLIEQMLGELKS
jgi:carboxyl-terminal processing protease